MFINWSSRRIDVNRTINTTPLFHYKEDYSLLYRFRACWPPGTHKILYIKCYQRWFTFKNNSIGDNWLLIDIKVRIMHGYSIMIHFRALDTWTIMKTDLLNVYLDHYEIMVYLTLIGHFLQFKLRNFLKIWIFCTAYCEFIFCEVLFEFACSIFRYIIIYYKCFLY